VTQDALSECSGALQQRLLITRWRCSWSTWESQSCSYGDRGPGWARSRAQRPRRRPSCRRPNCQRV